MKANNYNNYAQKQYEYNCKKRYIYDVAAREGWPQEKIDKEIKKLIKEVGI